jgi:hypothetical protein
MREMSFLSAFHQNTILFAERENSEREQFVSGSWRIEPTIMEHLPAEIVLQVFRAAAHQDRQSAYQLCLVNRAIDKVIRPILYKHVCLEGIKQVMQFNETIQVSPHLKGSITGITFLEDDAKLRNIHPKTPHWERWNNLFINLSSFTKLSTLVVCNEVCEIVKSLVRYHDDETFELFGTAEAKRSKLQIEHLIVARGNPECIQIMVDAKRVTWMGTHKEANRLENGYIFIRQLMSKQLKELNIHIGHKVSHRYPMGGSLNVEDCDINCEIQNEYHRMFTSNLIDGIQDFCVRQARAMPEEEVCSNGAIKDLNTEDIIFRFNIGLWGMVCKDDSLASKGWSQKRSYYWTSDHLQRSGMATKCIRNHIDTASSCTMSDGILQY